MKLLGPRQLFCKVTCPANTASQGHSCYRHCRGPTYKTYVLVYS